MSGLSDGRLTRLVREGRYREAAEYAKAVADKTDPANSHTHRANRDYWTWLEFLQTHTVEEIEAFFADPKNRKEQP